MCKNYPKYHKWALSAVNQSNIYHFIKYLTGTVALSILLTFNVTMASKANAIFPVKYPSIEAWVADQKIIRIYVDSAPGFGNQSASMNVMLRLRQMGFTGTFELVYPKLSRDKVITLFNLPTTIPDDYYAAEQNIRFIELLSFYNQIKANTTEMVTLGLTGGNSSGECSDLASEGVKLDVYGPLCSDDANFFNVQLFIQMSPYVTNDDTANDTEFELNNPKSHGKPIYPEQEDSYKKYFVMPVSTLDDAKSYLQNTEQGIALSAERPALNTFIEGMTNHTFNVMPLYGYTLSGNDRNTFTPYNILEMITAARYSQLNGSSDMQKPLILPIFSDFQSQAKDIFNIINQNNWGPYQQSGIENIQNEIQALSLPDHFQIADLKDANAQSVIERLQPGQILLLSMGSLPKIVFDGIYNHVDTNIWPQIREGANTFNSLVLTGRPHLRCGYNWEIGFDLIDDPQLKATFQDLYSNYPTYSGICGDIQTWINTPTIDRTIGDLIISAQDPESAISRYFAKLKADATNPDNDRIRYALSGGLDLLQN